MNVENIAINSINQNLNQSLKNIVIITGATAVGKSDLAIKIAQHYNGVIINADAIQIYKEIPILSAQPNILDKEKIEHLMYGYISGHNSQRYSIINFLEDLTINVNNVIESGKLPIIVGGSAMYIKAILSGISKIPEISIATKNHVNQMLIENNLEYLFNELKKRNDPIIEYIKSNDRQRIIRFLEINIETNYSVMYFWSQKNMKYFDDSFNLIKILHNKSREEIYNNCNIRFDMMIKNGVLEEIEKQLKTLNNNDDYDNDKIFTKSSGFKEIKMYLNNEILLNNAIIKAKQSTRNYAKRQLTWFRNEFFNDFINV